MNGNEVLGNIKTESTGDKITVRVDCKKIFFDQPPIIINGRTLVPVMVITESYDWNVSWNGNAQTVTIESE